MNKKIIAVLLGVLTASAYANQNNIIEDSQTLLQKGLYGQARDLLNKSLTDEQLGESNRAEIMNAIAEFYDRFVGDYDNAVVYYKRTLNVDLPSEHPVKVLAQKGIDRIGLLEEKFKEQNTLLKKLRLTSSRIQSKDEVNQYVPQLLTVINDNPEYYRLSEAYYYLGSGYLNLDEYSKAVKALSRVQQLKPAVDFFLPVMGKIKYAQGKWIRFVTNRLAWGTIGILLIVTVVSFYASRPWKWIKLGNIAVGGAVLLLWAAVFFLAYAALTCSSQFSEIQSSEQLAREIGAERPAFIGDKLTSPGSRIVIHLFSYMLVAVLGVFIFALVTSRLKCSCSAIILNTVFGLLLSTAMITVFYMRFCDNRSVLKSEVKGILHYPEAKLYFRQYDLEPYILTKPKNYPNLNLGNVPDVYLRNWIAGHNAVAKAEEEHKR